jgi:glycosyltransferase involved in cell wall biosynthesis
VSDGSTSRAAPAGPAVDLHVVVPVYNEAESFAAFYDSLRRSVRIPYRLVVVYDSEEDTTLPVAKRLAADDPSVVLVKNPHRGVLGALKTGLRVPERGAIVVSMADMSDDHAQIGDMFALYQQGCALVAASRYSKGGAQRGGPLLKRSLSRAAGLTLRWLGGIPTYDPTNNFKLYSKALIDAVEIESTGGFEVALELTVKAHRLGMRIGEVGTVWTDRVAGKSNFKLMKWLPSYLRWYRAALAWNLGRLLRLGHDPSGAAAA